MASKTIQDLAEDLKRARAEEARLKTELAADDKAREEKRKLHHAAITATENAKQALDTLIENMTKPATV
jgi:hypothetical protein